MKRIFVLITLVAASTMFLCACASDLIGTSGSNTPSSAYDPHSMDSVNQSIDEVNAAIARDNTQAAVNAQQAADAIAQQAAQAAGNQ